MRQAWRAGAARGTKSFLTETISWLRRAGAIGRLTVRADSAFYSRAVLGTARTFGVRFSVTARPDKKLRAAISSIPDSAWVPIPYWLSTPEVSGADVADTACDARGPDRGGVARFGLDRRGTLGCLAHRAATDQRTPCGAR